MLEHMRKDGPFTGGNFSGYDFEDSNYQVRKIKIPFILFGAPISPSTSSRSSGCSTRNM